MTRDEIQKLLGGYATGTLTPAEQEALFAAALDDQELFDALGREQSLRDLMRDPAAKAELLAALDVPRPARWWNWRPVVAVLAMAGIGAVAVVVVRQNQSKPQPTLVARLEQAPPVQSPMADAKAEAPQPAVPLRVAPAPEKRAGKAFEAPPPSASATTPPPGESVAPPSVPLPPVQSADARVVAGAPGVVGGVAGFGGRGGRMPQEETARALFFAPRQQNFVADSAPEKFEAVSGAMSSQQGGGPSQSRSQSQSQQASAPQFRSMTSLAASKPAAAPTPASLGVRYVILRRDAEGNFTEVQPDQLKTGDTLQLRFNSNANGFLRILAQQSDGTENLVGSNYVTAMSPYTTAPLHGETKLTVAFARDQQGTLQAPRIDLIQTGATRTDPASYVVNPAGGVVVFTITLKYQ